MQCFLCKGTMVTSITTYMTTYNNCYIIIKNVPCLKCEQCGEEYIDGTTMIKIESIIEKLKSMLTEIAVVDFKSAAQKGTIYFDNIRKSVRPRLRKRY